MSKENKREIKKIKLSTLLLSASIFVLVFLILSAIVVYRFSDRASFANKLSLIFPFPAIIINGTNFITVKEISGNLNAIKRFYENQDFSSLGYKIDFNTEDGKKRLKIREKELINKLIEDKAIEILAKSEGIAIPDKLVDESVDRKINEYGSEGSVKDNLKKLYGWSLNDFKEKVVKPSLYKDELEKWFSETEKKSENSEAKKNADLAMEKINSGEGFVDIAKENSSGSTSENGGHLGWFKKEYIALELQDTVASLEEGEVSDVIESKLGYHIIKLESKKTDENGEVLFDISQIYFPKASFADWLTGKIEEMNVNILITGYRWNSETGMVEFQDINMEKFEEKALEERSKDPSLLSI